MSVLKKRSKRTTADVHWACEMCLIQLKFELPSLFKFKHKNSQFNKQQIYWDTILTHNIPFEGVQFSGFSVFRVVLLPLPNFRTFLPQKEILYLSFPPHPWQWLIYFLYRFAYFGHFIYMESYKMWPFISAFFHLTCFKGSSMLKHESVLFYFS